MASITAPGIGSGLDVQSIVSQLMAIEQQPLQRLQLKQRRLKKGVKTETFYREKIIGNQSSRSL